MQEQAHRPWAVYVLTALMLVVAVLTGAFFFVWCGTVQFLFRGWEGILLLILTGFIAWRAGSAGRDAWAGLPSAPPAAIAALIAIQVLVILIQIDARINGDARGIGFGSLIPHIILVGLIGFTFWLSPHFDEHLIEYDLVPEDQIVRYTPADDDDDDDYLGGA